MKNGIKIETSNIKLELDDCCEEAVKCIETFAEIIYGIENPQEERKEVLK